MQPGASPAASQQVERSHLPAARKKEQQWDCEQGGACRIKPGLARCSWAWLWDRFHPRAQIVSRGSRSLCADVQEPREGAERPRFPPLCEQRATLFFSHLPFCGLAAAILLLKPLPWLEASLEDFPSLRAAGRPRVRAALDTLG